MKNAKPQTRPKRLMYSDLVPGMNVLINNEKLLVTDREKSEFTAWEHYEVKYRMLVCIKTGMTREVNEQELPIIFLSSQ